jgi:hypothetical protein
MVHCTDGVKPFNESLRIFASEDASRLAGALFHSSFRQAFPVPAPCRILGTDVSVQDWRQFVAIYTWPDGSEECAGFLNYIRYKNVHLGGGMCVKAGFYRRLSREHFAECRHAGGVAQLLLDTSAVTLADAIALFVYSGDAKAIRVILRAGYVPTPYRHLLIKELRASDPLIIKGTIDEIARIGPF